ncbi:MAG: isoprenyl transferase [Clostridia bacterium]|nr:isoprenyl transferase [Clostridia bacterium]
MSDIIIPDFAVVPRHVGVIMDGNGRWAKKRGLERTKGHIEGAKKFREIGEFAADCGVKCVTFYAFSTENWSRPKAEVDAIMALFADYLTEAIDRVEEDLKKGIRIRFFGDKDGVDPRLHALMDEVEDLTRGNDRIMLNLAVNYGGRQEITRAARELAREFAEGKISEDAINEQAISDRLYSAGLPDPDLIIRPSGEQRLSNFLIWQAAYSEFWYSDVLWPDFSKEDFLEALKAYEKRSRRFGNV